MHLLFDLPFISDETIRALCWTLVHSLWEGLIAALLAAFVLYLTKHSNAALRYNLLVVIFVLFLGTVGFTFLQERQIAFQNIENQTIVSSSGAEISALSLSNWAFHNNTIAAEIPAWSDILTAFFNRHASFIVAIWYLVFLLKLFKLFLELRYIRRIRRVGTHAPGRAWEQKTAELARMLGVRRKIGLMESERVGSPAVIGMVKPLILIPFGMLAQLPAGQMEAVLLHELAHIRRRDYGVNLLQRFAEILFFFNPAVLWISALLRETREHCCDDIAVSALNSKADYLNALLTFEQFKTGVSSLAPAFSGKRGMLLDRVKRIIGNHNITTLSIMEKISLIISVLAIGVMALLPTADMKAQSGRNKKDKKETEISNINVTGSGTAADPQVMTIQDAKGKTYKVKRAENKVLELTVDGQKVPAEQVADYAGLIQTVDTQIKQDREQAELDKQQAERDEAQARLDADQAARDKRQAEVDAMQAERDAEQAKLDAEQAKRDAEQSVNDREQSKRDREQAKRDAEQAKHDAQQAKQEAKREAEQAKRDAEQAKRDAQQAKLDAQQAKRDAEQAKRDAAQAEADRQTVEQMVSDLVQDNIVPNKASLHELQLTNQELIVNGVKQPEPVFKKLKEKYGKKGEYSLHFSNGKAE